MRMHRLVCAILFECDDTSGFSHDVTHLEFDDRIFVRTLAIEL